ncbi:MAG: hypothetical protein HY436_01685 [Candidatus Liptonbacteria bacterium]|nr:hypothetical protein [Candidatus Liptonbacteria bacterium]
MPHIPSLDYATRCFRKALSWILGEQGGDMSSLEIRLLGGITLVPDTEDERDREYRLVAVLPDGRSVGAVCKVSRQFPKGWNYFMCRVSFSDGAKRGVRICRDRSGQELIEPLSDDSRGGRPVPRDVWKMVGRLRERSARESRRIS